MRFLFEWLSKIAILISTKDDELIKARESESKNREVSNS